MSDQQHMDDFFKQQLQDYSPPVPEGAFERIFEERKKRRTPLAWWRNWQNIKFLALLAIAGFTGGGVFLLYHNDKDATQPPAQSAQQYSLHDRSADTKNNTANQQNGASTASGLTSQTIVAAEEPVTSSATNAAPLASGAGNNITSISQSNDATSANATVTTGSGDGTRTYKNKRRKTGGRLSITTTAANIQSGEEQTTRLEEEAAEAVAASQLYKMPFNFSSITAASLASANKVNVADGFKGGPDCPEAEKNAAGNKSYWEAYTSADYATKKYTDTANSAFAARRKETASYASAFSFGVRVTKVFNNGVSVRAGLNFSQVNERFSFVQSNTVQTTYIIDAVTGDTTGSYIVRGTKFKTSFNQYRTLDIPLVLGYEVGNGRLHANFNAGAMVNIYSWQKGELLDTSFQPVSITTGKGLPAFQYKTNIGVGFTAAASVYYKLNDRLHLLAEPYLRYNFSPMNKEALSLQEKFTTIGLRLGIRLDF